jgi:hypothetical protein
MTRTAESYWITLRWPPTLWSIHRSDERAPTAAVVDACNVLPSGWAARRRTGIMMLGLYGYLTVLSFALTLVLSAFSFVFVKRLNERTTTPIGEEIGSAKTVVSKVRKGEKMPKDELDFAKQIIAARSSLMTCCIPGTLLMVGCFYVFGSLYQLHGAAPSERTFLGVLPMLASVNLTIQILRSTRLKRRLRKIS